MIAAEITTAIGHLLDELGALGIRISGSEYASSFDNFFVDCQGSKGSFRIVRDRGQYFLDGNVEDIKKRGFFKAYDSVHDFTKVALQYATAFA
ncbi:MAG TPA: hypothetical protein VN664_18985 [Burkholderiales bacterium]|nr:hypothetical protein [Burkholderiales bacterium]